jgi:hypothetical protein
VLDLLLVALKPSVQIDDGNITGRDPQGSIHRRLKTSY